MGEVSQGPGVSWPPRMTNIAALVSSIEFLESE